MKPEETLEETILRSAQDGSLVDEESLGEFDRWVRNLSGHLDFAQLKEGVFQEGPCDVAARVLGIFIACHPVPSDVKLMRQLKDVACTNDPFFSKAADACVAALAHIGTAEGVPLRLKACTAFLLSDIASSGVPSMRCMAAAMNMDELIEQNPVAMPARLPLPSRRALIRRETYYLISVQQGKYKPLGNRAALLAREPDLALQIIQKIVLTARSALARSNAIALVGRLASYNAFDKQRLLDVVEPLLSNKDSLVRREAERVTSSLRRVAGVATPAPSETVIFKRPASVRQPRLKGDALTQA